MDKYDVIIIGAGAAGLTAGNQLLATGTADILILEAQDYIGGRIKTFHGWGRPIELGAEFIHGENMAAARIAHELRLNTVQAYDDRKLIKEDGAPLTHAEKQTYYELMDYVIGHGKHGVSIADIIERNPITADTIIRQLVHLSITDLETGDTNVLDSGAFADGLKSTGFNGENLMLQEGYQPIVSYLAKGLPIRLNSPVMSIDYSAVDGIAITLTDGVVLYADKVVMTVSVGVLQHRGITFTPELPEAKQTAVDKLGMGQAMKLLLRFKDPHQVIDLFHYADGENGSLQTITNWWASASDPHVIVGYCGGRRVSAILAMEPERLVRKVLADLSMILGRNIQEELIDYRIVRWDDNPYTYGVYSYHPVGTSSKDREILAEPIDGRIFWAGEATATDGNYAMVQGAIGSGYRVADEINDTFTA
jgi:monoamine oxidase